MMTRQQILKEIKRRVLEIVPDAQVWLYGSRARGGFDDNSDWDILVVTKGKLPFYQKDRIFAAITDISLQTDELITVHFNTFNELIKYSNDLFYKNVLAEKIEL